MMSRVVRKLCVSECSAASCPALQNSSSTTRVRFLPLPTCRSSDRIAEQYHSTPETQTEESYTHPEDLEHFAHHEEIELKEAEREAKFQGITVEEALAQQEPVPADAHAEHPGEGAQQVLDDTFGGEKAPVETHADGTPKFTRLPDPEKEDPIERFKKAKAAGVGAEEWGQGDGGYKPPRSPTDRMKCVSYTRTGDRALTQLLCPIGRTSHTRYRSAQS